MHIIFYLAREKYPLGGTHTSHTRVLSSSSSRSGNCSRSCRDSLSLFLWQSYFFSGHRRRATCPRGSCTSPVQRGGGGGSDPQPDLSVPLLVPKAMLNPNLSRNSLPMTPERPLLNTDGGRRHRDRSGEGTSASTYIYMPSESTHDSCYGPLTTGRAILGDAKYSSVLLLY